jgi:hypothetical protein
MMRLRLAFITFSALISAMNAAEAGAVSAARSDASGTLPGISFVPTSCSGCCSSHGGITNACGTGGRVLCNDGTTSPTCLCSSCGVGSGSGSFTCNYSYSAWGACQPNGLQTRSVLFSVIPNLPGCVGAPIVTQVCPYAGADGLNYTALWWNPAESGWGMNLNHQGTTLFVTIFTYDDAGAPMWLVGSAVAEQTDGSFSGAIYRVSGPPFGTTPWTGVSPTQVGNILIRFTSTDAASVTYEVGAISVSKTVQKQVFGVVPTCAPTTSSRSAAANYQDLWWNPNESGWGINLAHQGNVIFATLFTYDLAGHDVWLVASSLQKQTDGTFAGPLYLANGPAFYTEPWTPIRATQVGAMSLKFSSGDVATLSYTYGGAAVTKTIQRQVFGLTQPLCH